MYYVSLIIETWNLKPRTKTTEAINESTWLVFSNISAVYDAFFQVIKSTKCSCNVHIEFLDTI